MRIPEQAIFSNMCMIYDHQGRVLVQNRVDPNWPGIVFPGGHVEKEEAFGDSVIREVWEETGLTIANPRLCGVKHWHGERGFHEVVMMYKTDQFSGELTSSDEGEVFWVPLSELPRLPLASGMKETLRLFLEDEVNEYFFIYRGDHWDESFH